MIYNLDNYFKYFDNYLKFLKEAYRIPQKPKWTSPNKKILELDEVILRDFSKGKSKIPTFIFPPQAGHGPEIVNHDVNQSLVEAILKSGQNSVYVADWKSATPEMKDKSIEDYIIASKKCIEKIGDKVNLIGLCQGGWQSAIFTARFPEYVNKLFDVVGPIDFHAGNSMITQIALNTSIRDYEFLVNWGGGNMDGKFILFGFKMLDPIGRFFEDPWKLFKNINNEKYIKRDRKFRDWYETTQDIAGKFYLEIVKHLFKENKLIKNELEILNQKVDLLNIKCPLFLIAGKYDNITPKEQVFNLEHYVSSKEIKNFLLPSGHIGSFMGSKIIQNYWPKILKYALNNKFI